MILCPTAQERKQANAAKLPGKPGLDEACSPLSVPRPAPKTAVVPDERHCGMQLAIAQLTRGDGQDFTQQMDDFLMASIGYTPIEPMVIGPHMSAEDQLYLGQIPGLNTSDMLADEMMAALLRYGFRRRRVFTQGGIALKAMLAADSQRRLVMREGIQEHAEGRHSENNAMCRTHRCVTVL